MIRHAGFYDALGHRLLLGSLFRRVAANIADEAPAGARVLEIGCGPGRLSILLAREHGLEVTGVDLDPAMIEAPGPTPIAPGRRPGVCRRCWLATWPRCRSPTHRSIWS